MATRGAKYAAKLGVWGKAAAVAVSRRGKQYAVKRATESKARAGRHVARTKTKVVRESKHGFFKTLVIGALCFIAVGQWYPGDAPVYPFVSNPCMAKRPVGGVVGVSAAVGSQLDKWTEPPTVADVRGWMNLGARKMGEALGAFQTAARTGEVPMEPNPERERGHDLNMPVVERGADLAARAAVEVGLRGDAAVIAVAVAGAESGFDPEARNTANSNGTVDHGMWQINSVHADLLRRYDWRDPFDNARMMYAVSAQGRNWQPWVTYDTGAYKAHLAEARRAVAALEAGASEDGTLNVAAITTPAEGCDDGGSTGTVPVVAPGEIVWPVPGRRTGTYAGHTGVDINRGSGWDDFRDPIRATEGGEVTYVGFGHGYGRAIFVTTDSGWRLRYGHTDAAYVRRGDRVEAGELIGRVGDTGHSSAPHLHLTAIPPGDTGSGTYATAMEYLTGEEGSAA